MKKKDVKKSALFSTHTNGEVEVFKYLLEHGATINFEVINKKIKKYLYEQYVKGLVKGLLLPYNSPLYRCSNSDMFDINVFKYCIFPYLQPN